MYALDSYELIDRRKRREKLNTIQKIKKHTDIHLYTKILAASCEDLKIFMTASKNLRYRNFRA